MRCPRFPTRDPLVEFKTSLDKWYTSKIQSAWLYSGELEKSTISVLPPPVIHKNGLSNTKVLAFCSFLQRNQGTESTEFLIQELFLEPKVMVAQKGEDNNKTPFVFLLSKP